MSENVRRCGIMTVAETFLNFYLGTPFAKRKLSLKE
ncbi:hypothetical protein J2T12_000117 [Paenibacillus anaericanus]|nr:hypothetical protein [Paenibacillus anaericanus]